MTDTVNPATRSRIMACVRSQDTRPEMLVRRGLHRLGFRFRVYAENLPGSPDLVVKRYRAVVFVHGCYWHRQVGCRYATTPATRPEFWQEKFEANVERDQRHQKMLREAGWRVFVVWECALRADVSAIARLADGLVDEAGQMAVIK